FNPSPQLRVDGLGCLIKSNPAAHTLLNLPDDDQVVLSNYLTAVEGIDWPNYVQNGESMQFTTQLGERYFQFTLLGVPELMEAHLYGMETTQTVEAEKKLQIQHHFLLQIANHMGEGVYAIDQQGRLTFINQEAQRMLGYQEDELLGKPIHNVIHYQNAQGEPIAHESCPVLQTMLTGQIYRVVEDVFTHRDGRLIPVAFTSSPLLEGNQVVGSVNVFQDITQRKQMDQEIRQARDLALEASRLKSEFLANMSHEIRTPMNAIIGMTDLLLDTKLNKDQRELATTARESAHALLTIINDILDFSKIEAGKLELESAEFSPIRVVEGVAELVAPQAHNKSLDIICDVSQQVPPILKGDAGRIRQVLLNLAGNAVKFTKKGEIVLSVTVETRTETHVILRFAVSDTGIGVPKSAHHRLFQPFTQVDGSSSREYGGTGLGLSISSRLVEMMGGEIGLVSKKSKGSTFWFTVPLLLASTTEATKDSTILPQLKGLKVLLTVSNQTSQTILMNHLINWNMRCTAVESQEEAMAILRHDAHRIHPFQLAIVDDYPIAQEAMELVARIRQEPSLAETRVLLFTASKEEGYLSQAQEAGVNGYLYKPLRQGNLLECIVTLFQEGGDHNESPTADQPILLTPDTTSKTILLAEDNPVNQKVAQMQIRRLGLAVHTVANGKEAVEQAATGNYALILMDCQMPLLNGFEASQAIRRQEGTTRHIPIIALTANAMKGDRERCLEAGMDDYLSKPVEYPKLASKLRQWLNLAAPTPQTAAPVIEPPFDLSNLRSLFAGNMNAVVEALKSFLASSALLQQEMNDQINRQDRSGIRHTILAIQEASQQLEADNLDELCRQLDIVCSVGDWKRARVILDKLQAQLNRLETYVHTLPSG
ncbi:MAG: response regulator, partial [Magnetococcales bacterium]|nr:response regulator [Magnetococcales bacterium]